ncbi:MAG TPA: carboxypeptidase-like regulatory domain-containing protein [Candidatus Nitrosotalea sp.]|nr:carboxypeptidase-like regulatory domain-containing protein [Candidatus Nitrosotalea sp.]
MRNVLLGVLVLLTAACGAYSFPGGSPSGTGTVTGTVSVMPCGPIEQVPPKQSGQPAQPAQPAQPQDAVPCRMMAAAGVELSFTSGEKVASTLTDNNGRYRIELTEGTYKVSAKNYRRIVSGPAAVSVKAGSTVTADYLLDSGIRLPVPQQ